MEEINKLEQTNADILIVVQETDFLKYKIKSKTKFLFLHYKIILF